MDRRPSEPRYFKPVFEPISYFILSLCEFKDVAKKTPKLSFSVAVRGVVFEP